jgi:hypothetical protein
MIADAPRWVLKVAACLRELDLELKSKGWDVALVLGHYRGTSTRSLPEWRGDLTEAIDAWAACDAQGAEYLARLAREALWPFPPDGDDTSEGRDETPGLFGS